MNNPHAAYTQHLAARRAALAAAQQRSRRFWLARRLDLLLIAVLIFIAFDRIVPWWTPLLAVAAFILLMAVHQPVLALIERLQRAVKFYERGLARLAGDWAGQGETGERFADKAHPYSEDLDLFGRGSVFELLSTARTSAGEERLAAWLLAPAAPDEIRARQAAVAELGPKLDLREDVALLGDEVRSGVHTDELAAWGSAPPVFTNAWGPWIAAVIGVIALTGVVMWLGGHGRQVLMLGLLGIVGFLFFFRDGIGKVIASVERPGQELTLLAAMLGRIEREQFTSPKLVALKRSLEAEHLPPSRQIARLARLIQILDSTRNQFFAPLSIVLLIHAQLAFAIDRWRARVGPFVARWLDAVGELEALDSLAAYAYEHPADPFPEIADGDACFIGAQVGHPLLPEACGVRNDVRLDAGQQLLIVSGSNMSGKSTLMRTVGVNTVLALAGAPVRAAGLTISPVNVGASIHILDSLQAGASRFYAEITRLKQIVELTGGELPLLFLLDEILSGTNSHDRRIGAEAIVLGLVERGALGLITTHDLALTRIADRLGARAANVHFEDHLEDGRMKFDYQMRPGVVERSNALELMRAVGLDV